MPEWGESYSGPGMPGIRHLDTPMPTPDGARREEARSRSKASWATNWSRHLLFQSGKGFLRTITNAIGTSRPNRSAKLITARGGPFQIGVEKKFEMASLLPQACDFSSRLCGNAKRLRRSLVLDDMQPGAVLFFHLFCRDYSAAKVCELRKLALDRL